MARMRIIRSVTAGGFACDFEVFGDEDEGGGDEGDDADEVKAVHEGEELGVGVELVVVAGCCGGEGVGLGEALGLEVGGSL